MQIRDADAIPERTYHNFMTRAEYPSVHRPRNLRIFVYWTALLTGSGSGSLRLSCYLKSYLQALRLLCALIPFPALTRITYRTSSPSIIHFRTCSFYHEEYDYHFVVCPWNIHHRYE